MFFKSTILQVLIAAYSIVLQDPIYDFAASLPHDENLYINDYRIADLNNDGMPEIYISASSGWQYCVYYYLDGEVFVLDDLIPWAWSSELCYTSNGQLVMCAYPHTTGTAGNMQYRVYQWETEGYFLVEDLWRAPGDAPLNISAEDIDVESEFTDFIYISADRCVDPFVDEVDLAWLITQEEYEQKIANFDEMTSLLNPYEARWGLDWWKEHETADEIYVAIAKELLNWQQ